MNTNWVRRRCLNGQRLFLAWGEAMQTHDLSAIFQAMRVYFQHINGRGPNGEPCQFCQWERE